jgi:hypothetical protein
MSYQGYFVVLQFNDSISGYIIKTRCKLHRQRRFCIHFPVQILYWDYDLSACPWTFWMWIIVFPHTPLLFNRKRKGIFKLWPAYSDDFHSDFGSTSKQDVLYLSGALILATSCFFYMLSPLFRVLAWCEHHIERKRTETVRKHRYGQSFIFSLPVG